MSHVNPLSTGALMRGLRAACGARLIDVASDVGLSQSYISLLERNRRRLTPETADRIWNALFARIGR